MRVAFDEQLAVGTATGIGEYAAGLAAALIRRANVDVIELREPKLDPWRFDRRIVWDQGLLPWRARHARADVLHCASGTMPWTCGIPVIVTVHDVAWLRVQAHARAYARWYFGRFSLERYRHAAQIAVDSEFSRRELLEVCPQLDPARVAVVYPGVAADVCALRRQPPDRTTILVVGTVERRKNLAALVRILPQLDGARIVSVGPATPYRDECAALATSLGVGERVEMRGYVARDELLGLYARCAVVAVPSLYEGFGYAAAQAACAGIPSVVSDRGSLPEVAGRMTPVLSPDDGEAWTAALQSALAGEYDAVASAARAAAIERFSWDTAAQSMEHLYARTASRAAG
ncbi:MAG TPA: glycosyltransferase family 1 protein [Candidatus Tumulicola sp.]